MTEIKAELFKEMFIDTKSCLIALQFFQNLYGHVVFICSMGKNSFRSITTNNRLSQYVIITDTTYSRWNTTALNFLITKRLKENSCALLIIIHDESPKYLSKKIE